MKKILCRKNPAIAVVWNGDNYGEIEEFFSDLGSKITRYGLRLIIEGFGREIEVPLGWYLIVEEVFNDGEQHSLHVVCVPPEMVHEIYEII